MPVPDELRELVDALRKLHEDAGLPSTREVSYDASQGDGTISYETVAAMLRGAGLPRWPKLRLVVRALAVLTTPPSDPDGEVRRFQELWLRAGGRRPGDRRDDESAHAALVADLGQRLPVEAGLARILGGAADGAGEDPDVPDGYWDGDALDLSLDAGGIVSMRRHGGEIRLATVARDDVLRLSPHEAEEVALSLLLGARRARKETT